MFNFLILCNIAAKRPTGGRGQPFGGRGSTGAAGISIGAGRGGAVSGRGSAGSTSAQDRIRAVPAGRGGAGVRRLKQDRVSSLAVGGDWEMIEEFDLAQLLKLAANLPKVT